MERIENGKRVMMFQVITGIVLDQGKREKVTVSARGGGGAIYRGHGAVAPISVSSSSTTEHEIWLKTADGREVPIHLSGSDIPLRVGHKVSVLIAYREKPKALTWIYQVINHSTQSSHALVDPYVLLNKSGMVGMTGLTFALMAGTYVALSVVMSFPPGFSLIAVGGILAYRWRKKAREEKGVYQQIEAQYALSEKHARQNADAFPELALQPGASAPASA